MRLFKQNISILFLLLCVNIFAQQLITGIVLSEKSKPLEGVTVYYNNTTIGSVTNEKGEFSIKKIIGINELVFSYIGYATAKTVIRSNEKIEFITIKLMPNRNVLDEVIIGRKRKETKIGSTKRRRFLKRFKQHFLGTTRLASKCRIKNPEVIVFIENDAKDILYARADVPLKIENKALGYNIHYDLTSFKLGTKRVEYAGYAKYTNLKGSKRKTKKWQKERLEAYNGSMSHFLHSLLHKKTKKEGFIINEVKQIIPVIEDIEWAKKVINKYKSRGVYINLDKEITKLETELDSAIVFVGTNDAHKKYVKVKERLYYRDLILKNRDITAITFNNILEVVYLNEMEDYNYRLDKRLNKQISLLKLNNENARLTKNARLINPLDIFIQGYWAFEQFANALPLDYKPPKEKD